MQRRAIIVGVRLPVPVNGFPLPVGGLERIANRFGLEGLDVCQIITPGLEKDVEAIEHIMAQGLKKVPSHRSDPRLRMDSRTAQEFDQHLSLILTDGENVPPDGDILVIAAGEMIDRTLFKLLGRPDVEQGFMFQGESCVAVLALDGQAIVDPQFAYLSVLS